MTQKKVTYQVCMAWDEDNNLPDGLVRYISMKNEFLSIKSDKYKSKRWHLVSEPAFQLAYQSVEESLTDFVVSNGDIAA